MSDPYAVVMPAILVLLLVIVPLLVLLVIRSARKRKAARERGESVKTPGMGEDTLEGVTYRFKHFRGGKNAPPYFKLVLDCPSPGDFKVTRETRFDRFFKKLGVAVEVTTHDQVFDDGFYITTDAPGFARTFFGKSKCRSHTALIFDEGYTYLQLKGSQLTAYMGRYRKKEPPPREAVEKVVSRLIEMRHHMPGEGSFPVEREPGWKWKRIAVFAAAGLISLVGFITMLLGIIEYKIFDGVDFFLATLKFSIPALAIFIWGAIKLLRGRSSSHRELITAVLIAFFGFPIAGFGVGATLNAVLDPTEPVGHKARVVHKYISKSKDSKNYHLVVESWREEGETEKLGAKSSFYRRVTPQETVLTVYTGKGKFNYEWLVRYEERKE